VAQIFALAAGAAVGFVVLREPGPEIPDSSRPPAGRRGAFAILVVFALLLALLPLAAAALREPMLGLASVFYRAGALTFGDDQLLLPLLRTELVDRGWLSRQAFLAGYGAAQALPGPLFGFAAYAGAAQSYAPGGWIGGLAALVAIFAPGMLLLAGVLPLWDGIKHAPEARGAAAGACAAAVGLLAAAFWDPLLITAIRVPNDWALLAAACIFLAVARLPAWLVVPGFALATALLS
jgi:chromate transporter